MANIPCVKEDSGKSKQRLINIQHGNGGAYTNMTFDTTGYTKATLKNVKCYAEAIAWRYSEVIFNGVVVCSRGGQTTNVTWATGTTTVAEYTVQLNGATSVMLQLNTINAEANCAVGEFILE